MRRKLERRCGQRDDLVEVQRQLVVVSEVAIGGEETHWSVPVRVVVRLVDDHDVPTRAPDLAQQSGCLPLLFLEKLLVDDVEAWRNLVAPIHSLSADAGMPEPPGGRTIVDAADLVAEQLTTWMLRGEESRETA